MAKIKDLYKKFIISLNKNPQNTILLIAIPLSFIILIFCQSLQTHSVIDALLFIFSNTYFFIVNYLIVLLTLLLSLFFKKSLAFFYIFSSLWPILGIVNVVIQAFRPMPFSGIDFFILLCSLDIINHYLSIFEIILCVIGILVLITAIILGVVRSKSQITDYKRTIITYSSLTLILFVFIVGGNITGASNVSYSNPKQAYDDYGFIYCFSNTIVDKGINEPDNYSNDEFDEIIARYAVNDSRQALTPNIIMIQLESFFDTDKYSKYKLNIDPIPNFHKICAEFGEGALSVPSNGGGTVNTEFEILTGMNLEYFGAIEYPYTTVLRKNTCEAAPFILDTYGYKSHAIHNHTGVFYRRNEVYPNLGFDTFTPLEYMQHTKNELGWAKDEAILKYIKAAIENSIEQDFIFAVTVEGHGMYVNENRDDIQFKIDGRDDLTGNEQKSAFMYEYYCSLLNETDKFIGELYDYVMNLPEDTVVILYGDHLPSLNFDKSKYEYNSDYETTYTVFSNMHDFTYEYHDKLPANRLISTVFEELSINNGIINRINRNSNTVLYDKDLETVQYDMLYGNGYSYEGEKYVKKDIQLGIDEIEIFDVLYDDGYLTVFGQNFTVASRITINGWERDTEYIDPFTIRCPCYSIDENDSISIRQNAVDGKTLSEVFYNKF